MQGALLLCSFSNSIAPSLSLSIFAPVALSTSVPRIVSLHDTSRVPLSLIYLRNGSHRKIRLHCNVTQDIIEASKSDSEFVEVGYVSSVHGIQGEIRVKPNTGFPELRFSKPGRRWLRRRVLGREIIDEVDLVEGRDHPAKRGWILKFSGIDTEDLAKQFVGSTILVKEDDRPELKDGEFYTHDLIGMRVLLMETGDPVGIVVKVFNTGANDLLQVLLFLSAEMADGSEKPKLGTSFSGQYAWVPFVDSIVPLVDMEKREMQITPPEGLLTLNLRSDDRSKKERRQIEWKQRRKSQRRLITAKKKLRELGQQHVFHGAGIIDKTQKSLLANQIVGLNYELLQLVLQNIVTLSNRWEFSEFMRANSAKLMKNTLKMSKEIAYYRGSEHYTDSNFKFLQSGLDIISKSKVAIVLVVNCEANLDRSHDPDGSDVSSYSLLQKLLQDGQNFVKMENRGSVPLVVMCRAQECKHFENLFSENAHFGFDSQKLWFVEEQMLPVVSCSNEGKNGHKILMKSAWEMIQLPVGSGGVISALSSNGIFEKLGKMGVQYIQIRNADHQRGTSVASSTLLGFIHSRKANVGIQLETRKGCREYDGESDMIFSVEFAGRIARQMSRMKFEAVLKRHEHEEMVGKEWVRIIPSSPNSLHIQCSLYTALSAASVDKICVLRVSD